MQRWIQQGKNPWQAQTKRNALPVNPAFSSGAFRDTRKENKWVLWGRKNSTNTPLIQEDYWWWNAFEWYESVWNLSKAGYLSPTTDKAGQGNFFMWPKHGDVKGFHTCCGDDTFQSMVLGRSMHSSAVGSVKQEMEEDISGRAARTSLQ